MTDGDRRDADRRLFAMLDLPDGGFAWGAVAPFVWQQVPADGAPRRVGQPNVSVRENPLSDEASPIGAETSPLSARQ